MLLSLRVNTGDVAQGESLSFDTLASRSCSTICFTTTGCAARLRRTPLPATVSLVSRVPGGAILFARQTYRELDMSEDDTR